MQSNPINAAPKADFPVGPTFSPCDNKCLMDKKPKDEILLPTIRKKQILALKSSQVDAGYLRFRPSKTKMPIPMVNDNW